MLHGMAQLVHIKVSRYFYKNKTHNQEPRQIVSKSISMIIRHQNVRYLYTSHNLESKIIKILSPGMTSSVCLHMKCWKHSFSLPV
jgi:hypothetical protein